MAYAIVHFKSENSVAIVPSIWIVGEGNLCYWPPYRASRLEMSVKEREHSTVDWECINDVHVLHYYDTYHKARLNIAKAELDTSALESENENRGYLKNRRKKIVSDISKEELSDTNIPLFSSPMSLGISDSNKIENTFLNVAASPLPAFPIQLNSCAFPIKSNKDINRKRKSSNASTMSSSSDLFKTTYNIPVCSQNYVDKKSLSSANPTACNNSLVDFVKTVSSEATVPNSALKLVLEKLATMQQELLRISQVHQNMFSALRTLVAVKTNELPKCIDLPVKTLLDLKNLEKNLENQELAQFVINYLGVTGALNINDTTRHVLEKVFTNDLAKQLNWAGRCNKTGVNDLQIIYCVKAAVQMNKFIEANITRIDDVIKSWLKYAGDRGGGRNAPERGKGTAKYGYQDNNKNDDKEDDDVKDK